MTKVGDKKAARKFCGALRRAADPKAYEGLMYQLAEKLRRLPGKVLGVYQPIASEPDPMPAVRSWLSEGMNRTLALPWCLDSSASVMVYRIWHPGEALVPDAAGIPAAAGQQVIPDILLVPCLGWSAKHFRLGYGGGYFDRYLAALAKMAFILKLWGLLMLLAKWTMHFLTVLTCQWTLLLRSAERWSKASKDKTRGCLVIRPRALIN